MKDVILSILIGIMIAFVGCILAICFASSFDMSGVMIVVGLVVYLCIVVVACTYLIIKKIDKK